MERVQDFSEYNAAVASDAFALYQRFTNTYCQFLKEAEASSDTQDAGELVWRAFDNFRAAEQIGDAFFFEHRVFIDKVVERYEVEVPQPSPSRSGRFTELT